MAAALIDHLSESEIAGGSVAAGNCESSDECLTTEDRSAIFFLHSASQTTPRRGSPLAGVERAPALSTQLLLETLDSGTHTLSGNAL